jgi:hypothetical protein
VTIRKHDRIHIEPAGQRPTSRRPRRPTWDIPVAEFIRRHGTDVAMVPGVFYDPWEHARRLGIQVIERPIEKADGYWMQEYSTIVLRDSLPRAQQRDVLAHEIGHAVHSHTFSSPENEWVADRFAAAHLFTVELVEWALSLGGTPVEVARRLGTTTTRLRAWMTPLAGRDG